MAASVEVDPKWTVADVMRFLSMKKSWVYARAESGDLPCYRIGGRIRFEPKEVLEYWERCKVKAAARVLPIKPRSI